MAKKRLSRDNWGTMTDIHVPITSEVNIAEKELNRDNCDTMTNLHVPITLDVNKAEKKLTKDNWGTIFANVLNRGKTLDQEASRLGMETFNLIAMGDKKFTHSKEWVKCKRISKRRSKKQHL